MTTTTRVPRPSSARRKPAGEDLASGTDEILDAAAQMFMRRGYAATSIDDIAGVLGSSKGRVYHHYNSKAELFYEVHRLALRRMLEMAEPIAQGEGRASEKLWRLAHTQAMAIMTGFAANKVALQGLEKHVVSGNGSAQRRLAKAVMELRDAYEALVVKLINDGVANSEFAPCQADLAAKAALGAINWLTVWYNPEQANSRAATERIAVVIADFVTRGMRAD